MIAIIAEAARIEPIDRSIPPVRMTKVIPAASTILIAACCATIDRFIQLMNRSVDTSKKIARMMRIGSAFWTYWGNASSGSTGVAMPIA